MKIKEIQKYINEELNDAKNYLEEYHDYEMHKLSINGVMEVLEQYGYSFLDLLISLEINKLINPIEKKKIIEYLGGENDAGEKYYEIVRDIYTNEICRVFKKSF
ncbi:MAG: hypothetical protein QW469_00560 [Candidatus Aenigmatarchaeota archaeon]